MVDFIIIGAGPGGIESAVALKNKSYSTLIFESEYIGGKVNIAPRVDNFPPYEKIAGPDLAYEFYKKAEENHLDIKYETVLSVFKRDDIFNVKTNKSVYESKYVIVASGTKERFLGLPNEKELFGHGISYCALCDGHFFKNKDIMVVGGGNSAIKEAIYLAGLANHLYVVHRRNEFRCEPKYLDELKSYKNVELLTPYVLEEIKGEFKLESVKIKEVTKEVTKEIKIDALFPLIGQIPNTSFLPNEVLDNLGYVIVDDRYETIIKGLFAIGDVLPRVEKQIYLVVNDSNKLVSNL